MEAYNWIKRKKKEFEQLWNSTEKPWEVLGVPPKVRENAVESS